MYDNGTARRVPVDVFAPVLIELIERENAHYQQVENNSYNEILAPLDALAFQSGISHRTIYRILTREFETIKFETADRLLCALGRVYLWYQEPLIDVYEAVNLIPSYEQQKKRQRDRTRERAANREPKVVTKTCAYDFCSNTFEIIGGLGWRKKYCCTTCKQGAFRQSKYAMAA